MRASKQTPGRESLYKSSDMGGHPWKGSKEITYAPGKVIRRAETGEVKCCTSSAVHAARTPEQTAAWARWPYRLWEVEGTVVRECSDKVGLRQLTVIKELPVHLCFGAHGKAAEAVIRRAERLSAQETRRLKAAWLDTGAQWMQPSWLWPASEAAWAAWDAAWDAARAAGDAAWGAEDAEREEVRVAAGVVADTARVICLTDLISQFGWEQERIDGLLRPWRDVIGPTWEEAA